MKQLGTSRMAEMILWIIVCPMIVGEKNDKQGIIDTTT
jgi:hypothetical protein